MLYPTELRAPGPVAYMEMDRRAHDQAWIPSGRLSRSPVERRRAKPCHHLRPPSGRAICIVATAWAPVLMKRRDPHGSRVPEPGSLRPQDLLHLLPLGQLIDQLVEVPDLLRQRILDLLDAVPADHALDARGIGIQLCRIEEGLEGRLVS